MDLRRPTSPREGDQGRSGNQQPPSGRRLLPGRALNMITVGALHTDASGAYVAGPRVNLLDQENIFSPASRFGHGFRRSMKPEIFLPAGASYRAPVGASQSYSICRTTSATRTEGGLRQRGSGRTEPHRSYARTSNAATLATRAAAQVIEALSEFAPPTATRCPMRSRASQSRRSWSARGSPRRSHIRAPGVRYLRTRDNSRGFAKLSAGIWATARWMLHASLSAPSNAAQCSHATRSPGNRSMNIARRSPESCRQTPDMAAPRSDTCVVLPMNFAHRNLREAKLDVQPLGSGQRFHCGLQGLTPITTRYCAGQFNTRCSKPTT